MEQKDIPKEAKPPTISVSADIFEEVYQFNGTPCKWSLYQPITMMTKESLQNSLYEMEDGLVTDLCSILYNNDTEKENMSNTIDFLPEILHDKDATPMKRVVELKIKCDMCFFTCDNKNDLVTHMQQHITEDIDRFIDNSILEKIYKCYFCDFYSIIRGKLSAHLHSNHTEAKTSKKLNDKSKSKNENNKVSTPSSEVKIPGKLEVFVLECLKCDFSTISKVELIKHNANKHKIKTHSCQNCNFASQSLNILKTHVNENHVEGRPFSCLDCLYRGKTKSSFNQHRQRHFEKGNQCAYCDYKTSSMGKLTRHVRIHTGEKPYSCPHCEYRSNQDGTMVIHIRRHTGEKPFKCDECEFSAISSSSLNHHKKRHVSSVKLLRKRRK